MERSKHSNDRLYALVTGANSGLGFATCCRLIDEFLSTRPATQTLHLVITTRDTRKGNDTISRLYKHLKCQWNPPHNILSNRLVFQSENVDLTALASIHELAKTLRKTLPRIDAIILNAGIGAFTVNQLAAAWQVLTDFRNAVVYPTYKVGSVGEMTEPQRIAFGEKEGVVQDQWLGKVFCANVFGHYLLVHQVAPLLQKGRILWVSSLEAQESVFSLDDFQAIRSPKAYESSKRLADVLVLTSRSPSTKRLVDGFLATEIEPVEGTPSAVQYVVHPAICATSIIQLPIVLQWLMLLATHFARLLGSSWSVVSAYKGACAPTWVALASDEELEEAEREGLGKWGSAVDRWGNEKVVRTEVDGWGLRGKVEDPNRYPKTGRRSGAVNITQKTRQDFDELGRRCWEEIESLRVEWEARMGW